MSAALPANAIQVLRVQAVFRELDPPKAELIAAEMVARAHELANTPECECDVDVSIESLAPDEPPMPAGGSPAYADRPGADSAAGPSTR